MGGGQGHVKNMECDALAKDKVREERRENLKQRMVGGFGISFGRRGGQG